MPKLKNIILYLALMILPGMAIAYNPKAGDITNTPAGNVSSTNVQSAINELDTKKVPTTTTVNGHALSSNVSVSASDVGLSNVNNTSDANKPISTATQTALNGKVDKTTTVNGQALSSNVTITSVSGNAGTATAFDHTPTHCNSGYYPNGVDSGGNAVNCSQINSATWGSITGTLSNQSDLQTALNGKQASLGFTPENVANKSTSTSLGTSDTLYPSQNAVKVYVDNHTPALAWGSITGTLSSQTDLQLALNAKQNTITTGSTAQYLKGDLSLGTFPTNVSSFTNDANYAVPAGADTNIQFNDGGTALGGNSGFVYKKTKQRVGIQGNDFDAAFHVKNTIGETIATPASLSASLVQDPNVTSPTTVTATQLNQPDQPAGFGLNVYTYIDNASGSVNPSANYGQTGFTANCQAINYTVYAYRNAGVSGPRIINPSGASGTFTDSACDGSQFNLNLSGWGTPNGNSDGFMLNRADNNGSFWIDLGNSTSYTDTGFTNEDAYETSGYASTGATWNAYLNEYQNYVGTNYGGVYVNAQAIDSNISGDYLILQGTWSPLGGNGIGFMYQNNNGLFYDQTINVSFYDWGNNSGNVSDYAPFSSIAFPYFNTSLSDGSFSSNNQNDGGGSYQANGSSYNYAVYEYRIHPLTGVKYFTSGYTFTLYDNNDNNSFTWNVTINPGNGDGRIWVNTNNGIGADIGNGSTFNDDGNGSPPASPTPSISSYNGIARGFSARGLTTSPSIKYSASPSAYFFTDTNPVGGYVIEHDLATYGNATGLKDIETSYRGSGYDYSNPYVTPSSYLQINQGLGDSIVTPSNIGYLANGTNLNNTYKVWAYHNNPFFASPSYASITTTDPNDGNYYVVNLTSSSVPGSTAYEYQKVGSGYILNQTTSAQDKVTTSWGSGQTSPTSAFEYGGITVDSPQSSQNGTDIPIAAFRNSSNGVYAQNEFDYTTNSGSSFIPAGRYGVNANGNFFVSSINNGFSVGNYSSPNTLLGDNGSGTVINYNQASGAAGTFHIRGTSVTNMLYSDNGNNQINIGNTTGTNYYTGLYVSRTGGKSNNEVSQGLNTQSTSQTNYNLYDGIDSSGTSVFSISENGWLSVGQGFSNPAVISVAGGNANYTQIRLGNTNTLPTSPIIGGLERYDTDNWTTPTSAIGTQLLFTDKNYNRYPLLTAVSPSTSTYFWRSDSNGMPLADNKLFWQGSYIQATTQWLFNQPISMSQNEGLTLGANGYLALGNNGGIHVNSAAASDLSTSTTYGFKIGTATNQKFSFYGSSPIAQPSGSISTALANLGLIATPNYGGPYTAQTGNYSIVASTDYVIDCTGSGAQTITLPTAVGITGQSFIIKNTGGNVKTMATTSSQSIDGYSGSQATLSTNQVFKLTSNGANWMVESYSPVQLAGALPPNKGGTGFITYNNGDMIYASAANVLSTFSGNSTTTKKFITSTGTGSNPNAPSWGTIAATDLPTPTNTSLGGVMSIAGSTHQFLTSISTSGVPSGSQPAQADITGLTTSSSPSFAGETLTGDLTLSTHNLITDTSTGTKIGTATNQKVGFFNSTPIVQPTGNVCTALQNLGLVASCTESTGATGANPSASIGLTAVNGSASTFMRSDGAPALSQSIAPTWTGLHTFNPSGYTTFSNSSSFVAGTGGTITSYVSGGITYKVHTFTSSGTFVAPSPATNISYLVVGGGANGGDGGGGAGDFVPVSSYSASSAQSIPVTVGAVGQSSSMLTTTAIAGGAGTGGAGSSGGSGGGGGGSSGGAGGASTGINGHAGGAGHSGSPGVAGGGGGCGGGGQDYNTNGSYRGGNGGVGCYSSITGVSTMYSAGGAGQGYFGGGTAGDGGGPCANGNGNNGGGASSTYGGGGGSCTGGRQGVVIISYAVPNVSQSIYSTGSVGINTNANGSWLNIQGSGTTSSTSSVSIVNSSLVSILGLTDDGTLTLSKAVNVPAISNLTTNGFVKTGSANGTLSVDTSTYATTAKAVQTLSYQPGLLAAVNATIGVYNKVSNASTVDNIIGSAVTFSCISNPTITMYECGTSTTCASPTTIGTVTVTAAGTAVAGTVSNSAITAGDYIGWAMTAGTCASIDISATAQIHSN